VDVEGSNLFSRSEISRGYARTLQAARLPKRN